MDGEEEKRESSDEDKGKRKALSLVLTVRHGENFVSKKPIGEKCKLVAKLGNSTLESEVVQLRSSETEPIFNSQMSWDFTKKEFQNLRTSKTPLKLEVHLMDNKDSWNYVLGYCILHPRSAVPVANQNEVLATHIEPVPLVGTKEPWITYHPKLYLTLHLEDENTLIPAPLKDKSKGLITAQQVPLQPQKPVVNTEIKNSSNQTSPIRALKALASPTAQEPKFKWKVNDELGYFELGDPSDNDDLYVLYTTILGCECLHLLGPETTYNLDNYVWSIHYSAFGCDIACDPFPLGDDEDRRRTFIGDKATARVRSNGALFNQFLLETALEFRVIRTSVHGENKKVEQMGVSMMELKELARPEINSLKFKLDIVSTYERIGSGDQSEDPERRPEVRVMMELQVVPNFFVAGRNQLNTDELVYMIVSATDGPSESQSHVQRSVRSPSAINDSRKEEGMGDAVPSVLDKRGEGQVHMESSDEASDTEDQIARMSQLSLKDTTPSPHQLTGSGKKQSPAGGGGDKDTRLSPKSKTKLDEAEKNQVQSNQHQQTPEKKAEASPLPFSRFSTPNDDFFKTNLHVDNYDTDSNDIEDLPDLDIIPPGTYEVRIELEQLWLNSKTPLTSDFTLSFAYPPLGIEEEAPVNCRAKKDPSIVVTGDPKKRCAVIYDGVWRLVVVFGQLTDALLKDPIQVEIRHLGEDLRQPQFAVAKIPFGKLFFADLSRNKRSLAGSADVTRVKDNLMIGMLKFTLKLQYLGTLSRSIVPSPAAGADTVDGQTMSRQSSFKKKAADEYLVKSMTELENWKSHEEAVFREKLKEKEHAYLRILSEEWNKRDAERERQVLEKARILDEETNRHKSELARLEEKELELRRMQQEAADAVQNQANSYRNVAEDHKARVRRLKEQHKMEVESLMLRIQQAEDDSERMKGKLISLQGKLSAKEDELDRIRASRAEWPDAKLDREARMLRDKVDLLELQLTEMKKERDAYKREFQNLAKKQDMLLRERDALLVSENENLRAQLIAREYKKDLRDERMSIRDVADDIQLLKQKYDKRQSRDTYSGSNRYPPSPTRHHRDQLVDTYSELDLRHGLNKRDYLNGNTTSTSPRYLKKLNRKEQLDEEIARLVGERDRLLNTGAYTKCDIVIRDIENQLTRLASELDVDTSRMNPRNY